MENNYICADKEKFVCLGTYFRGLIFTSELMMPWRTPDVKNRERCASHISHSPDALK
jgi:hypothetical protein